MSINHLVFNVTYDDGSSQRIEVPVDNINNVKKIRIILY